MKKLVPRFWLVIAALLFTPVSHADEDAAVAAWTQQVLMDTLSVDYQTIGTDLKGVKNNYTLDAWEGLGSFLGSYVPMIKNNQLVLHPQALGNAQVVNEGDYSGIQFWRVNQSITIPELNVRIDFSVIVIKATNPPYVIQSLNMTKNQM